MWPNGCKTCSTNYDYLRFTRISLCALTSYPENDSVRRATLAILHYLRDHPQAKDSAKGIAQWWLGEKREIVEKALAFLVQSGVLMKKRHHYQLTNKLSPSQEEDRVERMLRDLQANGGDGQPLP